MSVQRGAVASGDRRSGCRRRTLFVAARTLSRNCSIFSNTGLGTSMPAIRALCRAITNQPVTDMSLSVAGFVPPAALRRLNLTRNSRPPFGPRRSTGRRPSWHTARTARSCTGLACRADAYAGTSLKNLPSSSMPLEQCFPAAADDPRVRHAADRRSACTRRLETRAAPWRWRPRDSRARSRPEYGPERLHRPLRCCWLASQRSPSATAPSVLPVPPYDFSSASFIPGSRPVSAMPIDVGTIGPVGITALGATSVTSGVASGSSTIGRLSAVST